MFKVGDVVITIKKFPIMDKINQSFVVVQVLPLAVGGHENAYIFKGLIDGKSYNRSRNNIKIDEQYYRKIKLEKICSKLEKQ